MKKEAIKTTKADDVQWVRFFNCPSFGQSEGIGYLKGKLYQCKVVSDNSPNGRNEVVSEMKPLTVAGAVKWLQSKHRAEVRELLDCSSSDDAGMALWYHDLANAIAGVAK